MFPTGYFPRGYFPAGFFTTSAGSGGASVPTIDRCYFVNNASSALATNHASGSNTLVVKAGDGAKFGPDYPVRVTVMDRSDSSIYTVYICTARSGDTLTVTPIEGVERSYSANALVIAALTKGAIEEILAMIDANAADISSLRSDLDTADARITNLNSSVAGKADDGAVVHKSGDETIGGAKTFTSPVAASITGNAATATTASGLSGPIPQSQVTNLASDLSGKLSKSSNLSDLPDKPAARTNLGLGTVVTLNVEQVTPLDYFQSHLANTGNPHSTTKSQVGLGNVDNTSDSNKPLSTATTNALSGKANTAHTHAAADITTGTVAPARLGTGTASDATYLRGDGVWTTPPTGTSTPIAIGDVTDLQTTLDGKSPLAGSSSITNLGTITGGNWRAGDIVVGASSPRTGVSTWAAPVSMFSSGPVNCVIESGGGGGAALVVKSPDEADLILQCTGATAGQRSFYFRVKDGKFDIINLADNLGGINNYCYSTRYDGRISIGFGSGNTSTFPGTISIGSNGDASPNLVVRKSLGQASNLTEWQSDTGTVVASVSATGVLLGNGSGLTNLNASNLATGTVNTARLGTGTASNTTFLRGDGTWATPAGGGGTPGGTNGALQWNDNGSFNGGDDVVRVGPGRIALNSQYGATTITNNDAGSGLILSANGGYAGYGALRIVANVGGWADQVTTAYFQIDANNTQNCSFLSGTYGADKPFNRLQFVAKRTTFYSNGSSTQGYNETPVPSSTLEAVTTIPGQTVFGAVGDVNQSVDIMHIRKGSTIVSGYDLNGLPFAPGYFTVAQTSMQQRPTGSIGGGFIDNTDATRKGYISIGAADYNTIREAIRAVADGTQAKLGFYGATPVAKAAAPTTLEDVIILLRNLGLCT